MECADNGAEPAREHQQAVREWRRRGGGDRRLTAPGLHPRCLARLVFVSVSNKLLVKDLYCLHDPLIWVRQLLPPVNLLTMSTASSNNDILTEAMQALEDNISAPQTPVLDSFWDIWHSDYLAALRERQQIPHRRKRSATKTPKEGDIVLMADDKLPRGQWPLGILITGRTMSQDQLLSERAQDDS
ncbi:unnamed protein product [Heligmosomoides polygyrus]|uniref:DUF5641 domain-containing protein n=1 Tax=Heligmosomoides polygyrus TaxID=6339 RepID=A0A183GDJ5_HELPZ|nr:unnamed protein product [Heligmosomoides polygyrus]